MSYYDLDYPTHIEVPAGYWTFTATVELDEDGEKNLFWHHNEED